MKIYCIPCVWISLLLHRQLTLLALDFHVEPLGSEYEYLNKIQVTVVETEEVKEKEERPRDEPKALPPLPTSNAISPPVCSSSESVLKPSSFMDLMGEQSVARVHGLIVVWSALLVFFMVACFRKIMLPRMSHSYKKLKSQVELLKKEARESEDVHRLGVIQKELENIAFHHPMHLHSHAKSQHLVTHAYMTDLQSKMEWLEFKMGVERLFLNVQWIEEVIKEPATTKEVPKPPPPTLSSTSLVFSNVLCDCWTFLYRAQKLHHLSSQSTQLAFMLQLSASEIRALAQKWMTQLESKIEKMKMYQDQLRNSIVKHIKLTNWVSLEPILNKCEKLGMIGDFMADESMLTDMTLSGRNVDQNSFLGICDRVQTIHEVKILLFNAIAKEDTNELSSALLVAEKNDLGHLDISMEAEKVLARLETTQHAQQWALVNESSRLERNVDMMNVISQKQMDELERSISNMHIHNNERTSSVDINSMVSQCVALGLPKEDALKLVMNKHADRQNLLLSLGFQHRLEKERIAENRRRDLIKQQDRIRMEREKREQKACLAKEKSDKQQQMHRENLQSQVEMANNKLAKMKALEVEKCKAAQEQRDHELFQKAMAVRHRRDRSMIHVLNLFTIIVLVVVMSVVFWETIHKSNLFSTSCEASLPHESSSWNVLRSVLPKTLVNVPVMACQALYGLKLVSLMFVAVCIYGVFSYVNQSSVGTSAILAAIGYIFRSHLRSIVRRSPWILCSFAFNELLGVCLDRFDPWLQWPLGKVDIRPMCVQLFLPSIAILLATSCSVQVTCEEPGQCWKDLYQVTQDVIIFLFNEEANTK